jgi:endogenous inhibitor of DNA gyrase (YacG/DUF329 family)
MKIKCPTCKKKTSWNDNKSRPFCSERCRLLDLGKWLNEEYKIECEETDFSGSQDFEGFH